MGPQKGTVIELPNGVMARMPKDWGQMSVSDLAKIGLHPDMHPSGKPGAVDSYVPTGAQPANAQGCSEYVCIAVTSPSNDGRLVNNWFTSGTNTSGYRCSYSAYWDSETHVLDTGTTVCGRAPGEFRGYLSYPVRLSYNWRACNTWVTITGQAVRKHHSLTLIRIVAAGTPNPAMALGVTVRSGTQRGDER